MASPTRWTWVWVNSGSWWWTGRPGVLRFMGLQRVQHDWATELNWSNLRNINLGGQNKKIYLKLSFPENPTQIFSVPFIWNIFDICLLIINWRRQWHPTPVLLPGKIPRTEEPGRLQSMGSLGVGHDWATSLSLFTSCIGEGNGNPLQRSCLENPRDGGAWRAAVYGVAQSRHDWSDLAAAAALSIFCTLRPHLPQRTFEPHISTSGFLPMLLPFLTTYCAALSVVTQLFHVFSHVRTIIHTISSALLHFSFSGEILATIEDTGQILHPL